MAEITVYPLVRHLRAEASQFIVHYRKGRVVRKGAGLAYWFSPLDAAVAQVPADDCETTFMLDERTQDIQDVAVQVTLTYRIADPERAATRVDFSISPRHGAWIAQPLARLASFWRQRSQAPVRAHLVAMPVAEAMRAGAVTVREALDAALRKDAEPQSMGLALVSVQVDRIAPVPDLEKALQAPTREALQQKADEAAFARRALAVEKERAIKENELATQIEMARRQEDLIAREGANRLRTVNEEAASERARVEAELARQALAAEAHAKVAQVQAQGDADAARIRAAATIEAESRLAQMWAQQPSRVQAGFALQQLASKVQGIQHLNVTPDLLGAALQQFLRDGADGG